MNVERRKFDSRLSSRDVLFTIACIVFVLANLGAIGSTGRRRAKQAVCLSNLRKWGAVFQLLTNDNDGYFFTGEGGGNGYWWMDCVRPYHKDDRLRLCPEAARLPRQLTISTINLSHTPWRAGSKYTDNDIGSYGVNGWTCNPPPGASSIWGRSPVSYCWRTPHVKNAAGIPVFTGMWWVTSFPREHDNPAPFETYLPDQPSRDEIQRACVNRHSGAVNGLFADWSARKVGLKELWTLKWHLEFNTAGPWTQAGGARPTDWPKWMKDFKDF